MSKTGPWAERFRLIGFLSLSSWAVAGCSGTEPASVLQVGSRHLRCQRDEITTELNRTTPVVREYVVGCDFMYTRVHCTHDKCYPAEVEPPCFGDLPCFEEDPVTLRWRLKPEAVASTNGEPRGAR